MGRRARSNRHFDITEHGTEVHEVSSPGFPLIRYLASDENSVVVAVHGACRSNGRPEARGSYGVFFGQNSTLNRNGRVKSASRQTNQYAELYAAINALDTIHQAVLEGERFSHLVLRTNSKNLALGLSQRVWGWKNHKWLKRDGQPVVNAKEFKYLHAKMSILETKYGMRVSLALVGRELNESAAALSKAALGGLKGATQMVDPVLLRPEELKRVESFKSESDEDWERIER